MLTENLLVTKPCILHLILLTIPCDVDTIIIPILWIWKLGSEKLSGHGHKTTVADLGFELGSFYSRGLILSQYNMLYFPLPHVLFLTYPPFLI